MKTIIERLKIEKNDSDPNFRDALMGAFMQKAPHARNITSAMGRAKTPM
jgi:hypothetical protein